jgi:hypothetical protein
MLGKEFYIFSKAGTFMLILLEEMQLGPLICTTPSATSRVQLHISLLVCLLRGAVIAGWQA